MTEPSEVTLAWAAGLFEGEGCIEIAREPRSRSCVRLYLVSTDLDVVERFMSLAACGSISRLMSPSLMKPNWKQTWRWSISRAEHCQRLLNAWLPHFGERRSARAKEALQLLNEKESVRWRTCYCGKPFRAIRSSQNYCSHEHQLLSRTIREQALKQGATA